MKQVLKKIVALLLAMTMLFAMVACGSNNAANSSNKTDSEEKNDTTQTTPVSDEEKPQIDTVGDIKIPSQEEALEILGLEEAPNSILCVTYNTTIMAYNLGMEITGTVTTTRPLPEELKDVPTIGVVTGRADFDFEKIVALAGDVVLADAQYEAKLKPTLDQQGIASCYVDTGDLHKLQEALAVLGSAFGKRDETIELLTQWQTDIEAMQAEVAGKDSPVVLVIRKAATMATSASYVGSLFKTLNITCATDKMELADATATYVPIDAEKILAVDPDYILIPGGAELEGDIAMLNDLMTSEAWASLSAVQNKKVIAVTDTYYQPIADMDCIKAMQELIDVVYAD